MIHPNTELKFINEEIGYGVVATRFISRGTITWTLDKLDKEISAREFAEMDPLYRKIADEYAYRNNKGNFILCWDIAKYVNHSFNASCLTTAYEFEIAVRDIHEGEELTDDYGYLNITEPFRAFPERTRRKIVYPDDLVKYYKVWDKKLSRALKQLHRVEQPLMYLVEKDIWEKAMKIAEGKEMMDSILTCYFNGNGGSVVVPKGVKAHTP